VRSCIAVTCSEYISNFVQRRIKRSDVPGIAQGPVKLTAYKPLEILELTDADVEVSALSQQLGEEGTHLLETDSEFEMFAETGMEVFFRLNFDYYTSTLLSTFFLPINSG
jgi:hypothetical protein